MIARLLQISTSALVLGAVAWVISWVLLQEPIVAAVGALVFITGHSLVLALELTLMLCASRRAGSDRTPLTDLLCAWIAESFCAVRVFCWRLPFRSRAWPDSLAGRPGCRGLLLVHGFMCNRGVWNRWYPRLLASKTPYIGLDLEPAFGSIDEYAGQVQDAVDLLIRTTGLPPVVVAHSMGGLAVRAWMRRYGSDALKRVHSVVTLATPHHGTALVKLAVSANVRQMAIDSPWLKQLDCEQPAGAAARFICIFSRCDNVVFPAPTSCLAGAELVEISRCAHIQMVDHPVSHRIVRQALEQETEAGKEQAI